MKIIYNSRKNRLNWGARSTGKALYQLLTEQHVISSTFDTIPHHLPSQLEQFCNRLISRNNFVLFLIAKVLLRFIPKGIWINKPRQVLFFDVDKTANAILAYQSLDSTLDNLVKGIKNADAVVINGEGSMIFSTPPRSELYLFFAVFKIAKEFNKKTFYVNAMASDCPVSGFNKEFFDNIINASKYCDSFVVRDPVSYAFLTERKVSNVRYCPDSLFMWEKYFNKGLTVPIGDAILPFPDNETEYGVFDFSKPYICIAGSSFLYKKNAKDAATNYVKLVDRMKGLGYTLYLVETCSTDKFLFDVSKQTGVPVIPSKISLLVGVAILANARLFITGRYHPAIMASLGGTPCVFMNSNSHKTYSLQLMLEYETPKIYSPELPLEEIEAIYQDSVRILSLGDIVRNKIKETVYKRSAEARTLLEAL